MIRRRSPRSARPTRRVDHDNPLEELFEDQLLCADLVVLNKADLDARPADGRGAGRDRRSICRAAVKVVETGARQVDPPCCSAWARRREPISPRVPRITTSAEDHDHDDFDSFVVRRRCRRRRRRRWSPASRARRKRTTCCGSRASSPVDGKPMRLVVQGVGERVAHTSTAPWTAGEARGGRLVVIGLKGFDREGRRSALCARDDMHLLPMTAISLDDGEARRSRPAAGRYRRPLLCGQRPRCAGGCACSKAGGPRCRLASLRRLRHPLSVDLYIDKTAANARFVLVRCLGGLDYWRYGIEHLGKACRAHGITLAVLPGDDRPDPRLSPLRPCSGSLRELDAYFRAGGVANMRRLLAAFASRSAETAQSLSHAPLRASRALICRAFRSHLILRAAQAALAGWRCGGSPAAGPFGERPSPSSSIARAILAGDTQAIEALASALASAAIDRARARRSRA